MSPKALRAVRDLALAVFGIALATALTACGSSYGSGTSSPQQDAGQQGGATTGTRAHANGDGSIDSCSLLTETQLSDIVGTAVTVEGPVLEVAGGRACTYTFKENSNTGLDEGTIDIAAWHGSAFFDAGTIGAPRHDIGDEAQDDSEHGVVIFRTGDVVVQVHVISPDHRRASVDIARAAADQVADAVNS